MTHIDRVRGNKEEKSGRDEERGEGGGGGGTYARIWFVENQAWVWGALARRAPARRKERGGTSGRVRVGGIDLLS